jgi:hypothetical protein
LQSLAHLFEPFRFKTNEGRTPQDSEIELPSTIISLLNSTKALSRGGQRPLGCPSAPPLLRNELRAIRRAILAQAARARSAGGSSGESKCRTI